MMRIVIDMQGAQTESRFRGIGRYTLSLARAIVRNRGEHEILLALNGLFPETVEPIRYSFEGLLPQENIRIWHAPGPVRECEPGNEWRREAAECIREAFLASLRPDIVLVSSLFEGLGGDAVTSIGVFAKQITTVATIHDLIPLLNPEIFLEPNPVYAQFYRRKIEHLKRANMWLAVSESAAREGRDALNLPAELLSVTHEGCDPAFRRMEITKSEKQDFSRRFGISQPFILSSGSADVYKNLHRLIHAYMRLPRNLRDNHQLVLPGKIPEGYSAELKRTARSGGVGKGQLLFTGYVTDEDLARLYNLCSVFVFPSYHEGFGLPALEAMACGAAVIGASATSLPEVIGRQDALFDPYDETAICLKLAKVLDDAAFRNELSASGMEQAKKFSWDESARKAIAAFEKLHSETLENPDVEDSGKMLHRLIHAIAETLPSGISETNILNISQLLGRNHPGNTSRQLLVDISELAQHDAGTGIQRVTRAILKELLENPPAGYAVEPVYATTDDKGYLYARRFTARFCGTGGNFEDEHIDYRPGDIFLGLDMQHHVVLFQKDYLSELRRDGVKVFFVVHDLLAITLPHRFPAGAAEHHKEWLLALAGFDGVVCVSRTVSNEFKEWLFENGPERLRELKITWSHNGSDVENSVPTRGLPDDAGHVMKEIASRPTFLTVGTVEPRKRHVQVLDAFQLLWREGVNANLVIVGRQGWMVEALAERLRKHSELNRRLFWLEGISDEYLEKIYAAGTCLIAASEGEGFGLPLIESARHKLPIIARDIPVFREVAGKHAFYFNGIDAKALADAVRQWLELDKSGRSPRSENMPILTWKQSAEQLIKAIT